MEVKSVYPSDFDIISDLIAVVPWSAGENEKILEEASTWWTPPKCLSRKGIRGEDESWEFYHLKSNGPEVGIKIEVDDF
jgi:hypothetical protein